jgi:hypothetical protein
VAAAALALAMLPVSQVMHSIGMIDHHFLEFTFVLLANWLGLRWFSDRSDPRRAVMLGAALGIAVAFHNGLFALQIPLLACAFILWLRNDMAYPRTVLWLAGALLVTTLIVALPSAPFREFMFEFALLSWFHVYIASCTSVVLIIMAMTKRNAKNFALLAGTAVLLAAPILFQAIRGASFVSGEMSYLDSISEVQSPLVMFTTTWGPTATASFYSWLIIFAPALLGLYAWRSIREANPHVLYFSVWAVFGLALLLTQYRLHYFGIFALIVGPCLLLQEVSERYTWRNGIAFVVALATVMVAWQPALRNRLFSVYAPASDDNYADSRAIFEELERECDADPGLVLADSDDGSPILFHTECSVLSNNFIMRPADEVALGQIYALMQGTPQGILEFEPEIKYVFLRALDFALPDQLDGAINIDTRSPIGSALLGKGPLPEGFENVHSVYRGLKPGDPVYLFARLLKINRSDSP